MAIDELEQLATQQHGQASQLLDLALMGVPAPGRVLSRSSLYEARRAGVAHGRVVVGRRLARSCAANLDTLLMTARPIVGAAPPPTAILQLEADNLELLGKLSETEAWLAAYMTDGEACA